MASAVEPQRARPAGDDPNGRAPKPTDAAVAAATDEPLFPDDDGRSDMDGEDPDGTTSSASPFHSPASMNAPPWWQSIQQQRQEQQHDQRGGGHLPNHSAESVVPAGGITMRDNETDERDAGRNNACWARSVQVTDYVIVNGSATNIGAFVVWNIRVETLTGSRINIRKRYSEFDDLRRRLMTTFPNFEAAVPTLPAKSVIWRFQTPFLEKRRRGLQYFLNCILLNPEFSSSPVLKDFLFA